MKVFVLFVGNEIFGIYRKKHEAEFTRDEIIKEGDSPSNIDIVTEELI